MEKTQRRISPRRRPDVRKTLALKPVTITVQVSTKYKWLAQQPWGQWTFFTHKPSILANKTKVDTDNYWHCAKGDHEDLTADHLHVSTPNWNTTMTKLWT